MMSNTSQLSNTSKLEPWPDEPITPAKLLLLSDTTPRPDVMIARGLLELLGEYRNKGRELYI